MKIEIDGKSLLGNREEQQDYFVYRSTDALTLAVVCDGMGGMSNGARASRLAAITFKEDIKKIDIDSSIPAQLVEEAKRLDDLIFCQIDSRGKRIECGTTIVSTVIVDDYLYWLTAGDSRIYICRGEEMLPINREHNYRLRLNQLLKENKITQADFKAEESKADELISYLGVGNISIMDVNEKPFRILPQDTILLCSDGVTKTIPEMMLKDIMTRYPTPKMIVEQIAIYIERTHKRGQDNATFVCLKCLEG